MELNSNSTSRRFELFLVGVLQLQRLEIDRAGRIAEDGRQSLGKQRLVAVGVPGSPLSLPCEFARVGEEVFDGADIGAISLMAVFSPMPGTPGILSEVSPIRASTSTTCSGPLNAPRLLNFRQAQDLDAVAHAARVYRERCSRRPIGRNPCPA